MFDKDFLNVVDRVSDIFIDFMEEKGFDVSADATTVEEAADEIYNFLKKRQEVQS